MNYLVIHMKLKIIHLNIFIIPPDFDFPSISNDIMLRPGLMARIYSLSRTVLESCHFQRRPSRHFCGIADLFCELMLIAGSVKINLLVPLFIYSEYLNKNKLTETMILKYINYDELMHKIIIVKLKILEVVTLIIIKSLKTFFMYWNSIQISHRNQVYLYE